ncbi:hypothetical protein BDW74DRAFT_161220, partial [Aspergillus multicolor]|uniref:uncharacterized protein n=1 Tax=Aspergillus multicolor TaxID=41759 RepID=UPI003CCCD994
MPILPRQEPKFETCETVAGAESKAEILALVSYFPTNIDSVQSDFIQSARSFEPGSRSASMLPSAGSKWDRQKWFQERTGPV